MTILAARRRQTTPTIILFAGRPRPVQSFGEGLLPAETSPVTALANPPVAPPADPRDKTKDLGAQARRALEALRRATSPVSAEEIKSTGRTLASLVKRGLAVRAGSRLEGRREVALFQHADVQPAPVVAPPQFTAAETGEISRAVDKARRSVYGPNPKDIAQQPTTETLLRVQDEARDRAEAEVLARRHTPVCVDLGPAPKPLPYSAVDAAYDLGYSFGLKFAKVAPSDCYSEAESEAFCLGVELGRLAAIDRELAADPDWNSHLEAAHHDRYGDDGQYGYE